jgi:hypothetical protein
VHYPSSCLLFKTHLNPIGLSVPHRKHITSPLRAHRLMLSIGLWRWYINITITILNIIHRPVFHPKHDTSETGFRWPGDRDFSQLAVSLQLTHTGRQNFMHVTRPMETEQTWPESTSELYRPSDRRLSTKLMPTFADRGVSSSQRGGSPTAVFSAF